MKTARRLGDGLLIEASTPPYTIRGISLGGVYTSIHVPELRVLLDVGIPIRRFCAVDHLFLSHGHGDHAGGLSALLGIRGLLNQKSPPNVYLPAAIADDVAATLAATSRLQRHELAVKLHPMKPGSEVTLRADLHARAFKTHHPVPSLGYYFFNRVTKLRPEFAQLEGPEIARRKREGEDLFEESERGRLAYATDTLIRVLDTAPEIKRAHVLILECTFLDDRKTLEASRQGCHIHLDELLERVEDLESEHIVLMHFSQLYSPREVAQILEARFPPRMLERLTIFAPPEGLWPG